MCNRHKTALNIKVGEKFYSWRYNLQVKMVKVVNADYSCIPVANLILV